jgi:hypothetical protein
MRVLGFMVVDYEGGDGEYILSIPLAGAGDREAATKVAAELLGGKPERYLAYEDFDWSGGFSCDCGCGCKKKFFNDSAYCRACAAGCCGEF